MAKESKAATFHIHTVGCKTNLGESDEISLGFIRNGFHFAACNSKPDIVIINTCTVTSVADRKVRKFIRRAKALNPQAKIIVTGCYAVYNKEELNNLGADLIIPNEKKEEIPEIVIKKKLIEFKNIIPESDTGNTSNRALIKPDISLLHSRALIKIQDGCEQRCSYCIVPFVRGQYRSTEPDEVLDKVKYFISNGYDEVVFTGIHIGKYGVDLFEKPCKNEVDKNKSDYPVNLAQLLKNILENTSVKRIRLSSMEINEIDMNLVDTLKACGSRIAPHLHIPLQSGSEKILRAMNRKYSYEFFKNTVEGLKNKIPEVVLTTDVMVGFPAETEKDFEDTLQAIKDTGFTKTHVFKYSKRNHTQASQMSHHIDEKTKSARSAIVRELGEKMRDEYTAKFVNCNLKAVCETFDKKNEIACGTSENYLKVYFNMDKTDFNLKKCRILNIRVDKKFMDGLFGRVINTDIN